MTTQQGSRKARVGAAALAAAAAAGSGVLATQSHIESQVVNVADVCLAKLKSAEDSVFANAVRHTRDTSRAEVLAMAFCS